MIDVKYLKLCFFKLLNNLYSFQFNVFKIRHGKPVKEWNN